MIHMYGRCSCPKSYLYLRFEIPKISFCLLLVCANEREKNDRGTTGSWAKNLGMKIDHSGVQTKIYFVATICTYSTFSTLPKKIYQKTAQEELEYLLSKSVKLCTQADVDYGIYHSKGVDSTLISTFHNFKNKFYTSV